jgi:rSAM/selenodomain-associated transferase 2
LDQRACICVIAQPPRETEASIGAPGAEASGWSKTQVSVIIPVLNERDQLPPTLAALRSHGWIYEVIVADGGSDDGTRQWLEAQTGLIVVDAPAGRGSQLNAGAQAASGDMLLFLHADTFLPADAGHQLCSVLACHHVTGGCFGVRFTRRRPRSLSIVAASINLRTRITHTGTGDQAIFVRRRVFEKIGGFREWPLFEDVDLVSRIKREGAFAMIPSPVTISPRRHLQRGVFRTVLIIYALRLGFWAGLSPFTLARWFRDPHPRPDAELLQLGGAAWNSLRGDRWK